MSQRLITRLHRLRAKTAEQIGERGFIKYLPDYDDRYHCLHTSTVLDFTPWGNGEGTITIQTANTEYILTKQ